MSAKPGIIDKISARTNMYLRRQRLGSLRKKPLFDPREAILISANPRGGSTWLFELLQKIPDTAPLLEPLHKEWVPEVNALNFDWHQRIPEEADWPEAVQLFEEILSGRQLTWQTCQHAEDVNIYKTSQRLVIKFVRINGMLPWLVRQFEFRLKPVVLTRHPFAMVASMMRHPGWGHMPSRYVFPNSPYSEYAEKDRGFLENLSTIEEVLVAKWCTRNRGLLRSPGHNRDWITIHYEHLLMDPEENLRRLFSEWDMALPDEALQQTDIASREARENDFQENKSFQLEKWKERFDADQLSNLQRVMDHFEIDLYGESPFPNMTSKMAAK